MRIVLDPGHGGRNTGTRVGEGLEKDYTLRTAEQLALYLRADGHTVKLTRTTDETTDFLTRGRKALDENPDLTLCLHVNAMYRPAPIEVGGPPIAVTTARGMICFYLPDDQAGRGFAADIIAEAPKELRRKGQGTAIAGSPGYPAPAVCLRQLPRPCVLVEMFFASNPADLAYGLSKEGQLAIVRGIADAIGPASQWSEDALDLADGGLCE